MKQLLVLLLTLLPLNLMSAYENAFDKTPVGTVEIKTLPAARLLAARGEGNYFEENNGLFRPLFRYIQANDIAMTTPVEAEIEPGIMYFYLGADYADLALADTERVQVTSLPERTVLSIGVRGSYNAANFNEAQSQLLSCSHNKTNGPPLAPPAPSTGTAPLHSGFSSAPKSTSRS